jgi:5'-3' exonuclease
MWRASIGFAPKKTEAPPPEPSDSEWEMRGDSLPPEPEPPADDYVLIFNFFRNLRPIIELFAPDKCFFVLEGHPQFRYDLFADYKANRIIKEASKKERREKFTVSADKIVQLMRHLPITIARAANYEADDVIATLCEDMKEESLTILSNDSDYIQLLQRGYRRCQIYNPIKKVFMEAPPYHYVAWKSLNGDKSDNIPSLLSPKKALAVVSTPELFQRFMETEENRANFNINRQLIEFRAVPEEEIIVQDGTRNFPALKEEFHLMKFESIINDKSWEKYTKTFNCLKF